MNKKIFRLNLFTSMFVLLISFSLVFAMLYSHFESHMFAELENEAEYISYAIDTSGISYIDKFKGNGKRITLVDSGGVVLADTSADPSELDNHRTRTEIKDAVKFGNGTSSRYSDTLMEKTLYYAVKLPDGNILRVSATQRSVIAILAELVKPLVIIILIALLISWFLSAAVSKSIIKPINELDPENPFAHEVYEELSPLLAKLSAQKKTIDRQISDAVHKQEEFKLITENMSEGLLVIDNDYNVLTYNNAALRLLEIDNVNPGSVLRLNRTKGFRTAVEKAVSGERAQSSITQGDRIYSLIASPVPRDEKIIGAVIVIIDVTENANREQLRREFTSNVSHELKTPLTSISGFAEMMKQGGTPDETVVDFSTSIYDEAQRLISLVSDIIKMSELDESSPGTEKTDIDLYSLSENVLKRLKPIADRKNITLTLKGDTAIVSGSEKILDEMIYNLCDNAIKYNRENGSADIIITKDEQSTRLTVRDTGIGIPTNEQDRVFERFYRVDKSHSKLIGGTGLGLSIVKHAAIYHDAEIDLESCEGVGTSITIIF